MNEIIVLTDLGVGGQRGRVFDTHGIIGALSATDYKDPPKILTEETESESNTDWKPRKTERKL